MKLGSESTNMLDEVTRKSIIELVKGGRRADDRDFEEMRKVEIIPRTIPYAAGSALVKLGKTMVLAGVKLDPGKPYPDTPNQGTIMVNVELLPLASPEYEYGAPGPFPVGLARTVDRGIRSAEMIDLEKLMIEPELAWSVFIDIDILNNDGNLVDACSLAAVAALMNTRLPKFDTEKKQNIPLEFTGPLPLKGIVTTQTWAKIGDRLVRDPNADEETAMDAYVSISVYDNFVCAIQKNGSAALKKAELDYMIEKSFEYAEELKTLLKKSV